MKTRHLFFAAVALTALGSCADDSFTGDPSQQGKTGDGSITFSSSTPAATRADHVGADAADMLGGKFYVGGFKNDGSAYSTVFDNYKVEWEQNTAGKTTDNTSDWKYVGVTNPGFADHISGSQTIKYWDYAASYYDFVAYSPGKGNTLITTGTPTDNQILATAIAPTTLTTAAYTLQGSATDLSECYIADLVTAKDGGSGKDVDYKKEVSIKFRRLGSKVRVALYETIPGYSVRDVKFYSDASTTLATGTSETSATLFTSANAFSTTGTMTVKFPTIGTSNTAKSDYNKAHVTFAGTASESTKAFGTLNYEATKANWEDSRLQYDGNTHTYLKRTSTAPSFAGTDPYYLTVLPDETGNVLELRVDYTLESIDGTKETIVVHGATAFVPQIYAAWKPNYAYTYIFKITDNTNGWTNTAGGVGKDGLYPITLDAVVADSEDGTQSTITTVATPSITTYMKGHDYEHDGPEYKAGTDSIYIRVMDGSTIKNDLNTKGKLYTVTGSGLANATEADMMDALNVQVSETSGTVVGRNGFTLTPATEQVATGDATFGTIPGADGNNITGIAANTATRFLASAATYAYVYDYTDGTPEASDVITAVESATAPDGWDKNANIYYEDAACTIVANYVYHNTEVTLSSKPADWNESDNVYYTDAACETKANSAYADGTYYKKGIYYRKYTNRNHTYSVKVIVVQ